MTPLNEREEVNEEVALGGVGWRWRWEGEMLEWIGGEVRGWRREEGSHWSGLDVG